MTAGVETACPPGSRGPRGLSPALVANTGLALLGAGLSYYLWYFHPVAYVSFVSEDSWVEWATFVSYLLAFCLLAWALWTQSALRKPGLFLLAVATLFVAMEEIDWGQRLLGFQSPQFFAKQSLTGATNLHNLVKLDYEPIGVLVFAGFLLLPFLAMRSRRVGEWCSRLGIPLAPIHTWPFFIAALYFIRSSIISNSELAEAYLGIGVAAVSLDLALTARRGHAARRAEGPAATGGLMVVVVVLTSLLVWLSPWPEQFGRNLNRFAIRSYRARGMLQQAEMLFDYINRHPQFLETNTRFFQGEVLMRLGRVAEAREILEAALTEQQQRQREDPDDPGPHRMAGRILALLGRPEEARSALLTALEKDAARLERAEGDRAKLSLHRSRALTLIALGDHELADAELSRSRALLHDRRSRRRLERVIRSVRSRRTAPVGVVD